MANVYDEALLDAKKIKEAAEQAAREKVMETITPQIRDMINARILFEQDEYAEDDLEATPDKEAAFDFDTLVDSMPDIEIEDEDAAIDSAADVASTFSIHADGDVNIEIEGTEEEKAEDVMSDVALAEAFAHLVRRDFGNVKSLEKRIVSLQERVQKLSEVLKVVRESRLNRGQQERLELSFVACVKEAVSLHNEMKQSGRGHQRLDQMLNSTIKEMRKMSSKYKRNIFDFLFEADDAAKVEGMHAMKEQDETEDAMADEAPEADAPDVDVDAASAALKDLGAALGLDLEIEEETDEDEDVEDAEEAESDEMDLDLEEADMYEMMHEEDMDEVYEIDESVLRRELAKMRKSRRIRESAEEEADQFGGAEILGDVIEVDEETLINVLADELGSVSESRRRRNAARPVASASARKAMREAAEYKQAATKLKKQLVEMNLFNAKLLYANKLLQNKNLTVKQQRAIVEALDNAKTLREAKLLYKSLSESLARRGQSGKTISESVNRTLGSSSRSTRSAQPANSGVETDRWAVLAGIGK
jgi:hypothetical protein